MVEDDTNQTAIGACGRHADERVVDRWVQHRAGKADQRLFLWSWLALQYILHSESDRKNLEELMG